MVDTLIVFLGTYLIFVMIAAVGVYGFSSEKVRWLEYGLSLLGALVLGYLLARLGGLFFYHEQPYAVLTYTPLIPHDIDNAFPSDHAVVAGAIAGIASLYNRAFGLLMWLLALGVAAGRMLAGVHYPVDVIVGLILGGVCAAASHYAIHRYFSGSLHTE